MAWGIFLRLLPLFPAFLPPLSLLHDDSPDASENRKPPFFRLPAGFWLFLRRTDQPMGHRAGAGLALVTAWGVGPVLSGRGVRNLRGLRGMGWGQQVGASRGGHPGGFY